MNPSADVPLIVQTNEKIGDRGLIHIYDADPAHPRPFIIGVHGGGWKGGDQGSYAFLRSQFRPLGCALVLVSYRVASEAPFPAAYDDLIHVLGWLKENGAAHGLDSSRSLLFGSSAGGHLVMLLASRGIRENRPMPQIRGVVECCGIMDLSAQYAFDTEAGKSMTKDFLKETPDDAPDLYRDASPICHIHDRMPPVWIAHGSADGTVPVTQSRAMVDSLRRAGHAPIYLEAFGLSHTMCECTPEGKTEEPITLLFKPDMLRFMHRHLNETGGSDPAPARP